MSLCKNIIGFKNQELGFLKTMTGNQNPYKYLSWFLKNSEQFNEVNKQLSQKISTEVHAKIKECYHNTWKASYNRNYKYYEGFVWSKDVPIPLEHSWLTYNNKVIDPTMIIPIKEVNKQLRSKYKGLQSKEENNRDRLSRDRLGIDTEYVGVNIPTETLNKFVMKNKKTGGFLLEYFLSQGLELIVHERLTT